MFGAKNIFEFLEIGGISMYLLFFCSILFVGVFIERVIEFYKKSKLKKEELLDILKENLSKKDVTFVKNFCRKYDSPFARVIETGLENIEFDIEIINNAIDRRIIKEIESLEKYTAIIGTIGNISVYLGLLGTVLGIIKAFESIAITGSSNVNIVIKGVAEALSTTAVGLMIAIPATIAYNYFQKKIEWFNGEMEYVASEFIDIIKIWKSM